MIIQLNRPRNRSLQLSISPHPNPQNFQPSLRKRTTLRIRRAKNIVRLATRSPRNNTLFLKKIAEEVGLRGVDWAAVAGRAWCLGRDGRARRGSAMAVGNVGGWAGAGDGCSGSRVCWTGYRAGMGGRWVHFISGIVVRRRVRRGPVMKNGGHRWWIVKDLTLELVMIVWVFADIFQYRLHKLTNNNRVI